MARPTIASLQDRIAQLEDQLRTSTQQTDHLARLLAKSDAQIRDLLQERVPAPASTAVEITISTEKLNFWRPKALLRLRAEQPNSKSWPASVVNSLAQQMCIEAAAKRASN